MILIRIIEWTHEARIARMVRIMQAQYGIALLVAATACFGALDTTVKFLGAALPLAVTMWSRYVFQALVTGAMLFPARGRRLLDSRHPRLQLLRGVLMVLSSSTAFLSLQFLPVAEFTALIMLTPLAITVVSAISLRERVSPLRWLLLLGGLAGALIVIRPGTDDFRWSLLLPLGTVVLNAGYQLVTSRLAASAEDAGTMHLYTGLVATAVCSLALPFSWQTPDSGFVWLMLVLLGAFSSLGHYLLILAYGRASPATLTPYLYAQIAFAVLAGWLVFAHKPDAWAVVGIALIAGSGVLGTWLADREKSHTRPA